MSEPGFSIPTEFKGGRGKRQGSSPVGDVPGVKLDQWGRYVVQLPHWEREDSATRVTTITGTGNSNEGLRIWTERGIGQGLALEPRLRTQLAVWDSSDVKALDEILEAAKVRAGLHDARERGTALHREWERWVKHPSPEGFYPAPELADDVTAGIRKFQESGLQMIVVEQLVLIDSLRVAGRLDCVVRAPNGKLRIFDWKSGKDLTGSDNCAKRAQYARQLAAYANADWIRSETGAWARMDTLLEDLDREIGYILHVNEGVAQLYEVPIGHAWREFQALAIVHRGNSSQGAPMFTTIGRPVIVGQETPEPERKRCPGDPQHFEDSHYPGGAYYGVPIDHVMPESEQPESSISIGLRCPSCDELAAEVDGSGDWNCVSCQAFGTAYDQLIADLEQNADATLAESTGPAPVPAEPEPASVPDSAGGTPEGIASERSMFEAVSIGQRCPDCGRTAAQVDRLRNWDCVACGAFGTKDYDHLIARAINQTADDIAQAMDIPPQQAANAITQVLDSQQLDGEGNPLQPLASEVGKRGCGVCGRVGHKRGSAKCLRDADPAKVVPLSDLPVHPAVADLFPDHRVQQPIGFDPTATPDYCDGMCTNPDDGPPSLQPERDADGRVTGRYVCAGCGKPATVDAVRAHVTSFSGDARPPEEREATHVRLVQPDTIPEPPKPLCAHRNGWSVREDGSTFCPDCGKEGAQPQPAEPWAAYIEAAKTPAALGHTVSQMQAAGEATPELLAAASERWAYLHHEGA